MHEQTIFEQILSGIFIAIWIVFLPFYWLFLFSKWFVVSVAKETSNRLVKISAIALAGVIVTLVLSKF